MLYVTRGTQRDGHPAHNKFIFFLSFLLSLINFNLMLYVTRVTQRDGHSAHSEFIYSVIYIIYFHLSFSLFLLSFINSNLMFYVTRVIHLFILFISIFLSLFFYFLL